MRIRITEGQHRLLLKENEYHQKVVTLLKTGQLENIELAFQIGESGLG